MKNSVIKDILENFIGSYGEFGDCRGRLWLSSILLLFVQVSGLFETYVVAGITDSLYKRDSDHFALYLAVAVVVGFVTIMVSLANAKLDLNIQQSVIVRLKERALEKILQQE